MFLPSSMQVGGARNGGNTGVVQLQLGVWLFIGCCGIHHCVWYDFNVSHPYNVSNYVGHSCRAHRKLAHNMQLSETLMLASFCVQYHHHTFPAVGYHNDFDVTDDHTYFLYLYQWLSLTHSRYLAVLIKKQPLTIYRNSIEAMKEVHYTRTMLVMRWELDVHTCLICLELIYFTPISSLMTGLQSDIKMLHFQANAN